MASTQTSLSDFFKNKKSARDGLKSKNVKVEAVNIRQSTAVAIESNASTKNKVHDELTIEEVSLISKAPTQVKQSNRTVKKATRGRNSSKVDNKNENILLAFQRSASKKIAQNEDLQENESVTSISVSGAKLSIHVPINCN